MTLYFKGSPKADNVWGNGHLMSVCRGFRRGCGCVLEERHPRADNRGRLHLSFQAPVAAPAGHRPQEVGEWTSNWDPLVIGACGQALPASYLEMLLSLPTFRTQVSPLGTRVACLLLPALSQAWARPLDRHALAPPLLGKFPPGGSEGLTGSSSAPTTGPDSFTRQCVTWERLGSSLLSLAPHLHTLPCSFLLPSVSHG